MAEKQDQSDVVFLLGAGASKAAGVPDTYEFVDAFRESLETTNPDRRVLDEVLGRLGKWRDGSVDIELLLDALTRVAERNADPGLVFCKDPSPSEDGLVEAVGRLASALRNCIKNRTYVRPDQTAHLDPLMDFIRHHGCIDIATLNYDTVIEEFGYRQRVAVHDGFQTGWNLDSLRSASSGIRLLKLHGSVTWYETGDGRYVKDAARLDESQVELVQGGSAESLMLYPVRKWAYSEPMVGLLFEFKRLLEASLTRFLVVVGYSFRDDHVQGVIRDAARNNPQLEVVLVDPAAHAIKSRLFDAPAGRAWPGHLRRRIHCLPYRFESIVAHLKHDYLKHLRTGVGGEADSVLAEAKGAQPLHWGQAAKAFGECEHFERLDEVLQHANPLAAELLAEFRARVLAAANLGLAEDRGVQERANSMVAYAVRSCIAERLYCDLTQDSLTVTTWHGVQDRYASPADNAAQSVEEVLGRVRRSLAAAVRETESARAIVALLKDVSERLHTMARKHSSIDDWLAASRAATTEQNAVRVAWSHLTATTTPADRAKKRDELVGALGRAARSGIEAAAGVSCS